VYDTTNDARYIAPGKSMNTPTCPNTSFAYPRPYMAVHNYVALFVRWSTFFVNNMWFGGIIQWTTYGWPYTCVETWHTVTIVYDSAIPHPLLDRYLKLWCHRGVIQVQWHNLSSALYRLWLWMRGALSVPLWKKHVHTKSHAPWNSHAYTRTHTRT